MRQNVTTVIEHTTKEVLEARAKANGTTLSRYIRKVLEEHERAPFMSKEEKVASIADQFGDD